MNNFSNFLRCIKTRPQAAADMKGSRDYPIYGAEFYSLTRAAACWFAPRLRDCRKDR